MKKLVTFVLAAVTALSMTCTAFAAPSPAAATTGATIDGKEVKMTTSDKINVAEPTVDDLVKEGLVKAGAEKLGVKDITIEGVSAEHPATFTVSFANVKAGDNVVVLHYVNGAWQRESKVTALDGAIQVTVTSCSPFMFLKGEAGDKASYKPATTTPANNASATKDASPKTGETAAIPAATLVCLLAMAGVVLVSKKRRA